MTVGQQFPRKITFTAGLPGLQAFTTSTQFISFSVKKDKRKGPNKCEVKITNLKPPTLKLLEATGSVASLAVGYEGLDVVIFDGDVSRFDSKKTPTGSITSIRIGNGEIAYAETEFCRSIGAGTPYTSIIAQIALEMNLPLGNIGLTSDAVTLGGQSFFGPARKALTTIARAVGADWSIQEGALVFTTGDIPLPDTAVLLTGDSGLLDSTRIVQKRNKSTGKVTTRAGWTITTQLNPGFKPGRTVSIASIKNPQLNGLFTIRQVAHQGDNRGGKFTSVLEVREFRA